MCGQPTEDAYSSGHLVLSHKGLAFVLMLRPFSPELVMSTDQVSGGVSVLCWLAAPVAMFYGNLQNLVIRSKSVIKSSSVISSQIGVMSDQLRVSLNMVMSQNVM